MTSAYGQASAGKQGYLDIPALLQLELSTSLRSWGGAAEINIFLIYTAKNGYQATPLCCR